MPGGDRTGPLGEGRLTGRGAGYCAGYSSPGFENWRPGFGRGCGAGWGGRGGRGIGFARGGGGRRQFGWGGVRGGWWAESAPTAPVVAEASDRDSGLLSALRRELAALRERIERLERGPHDEG